MSAAADTGERRHNAAQLRLLLVIEMLSGHEVSGLRLVDVANGLKLGPPTVLRDLQALEEGGWAQQMEDGKWRLAAKPIQVLTNFQWGLQSAGIKLTDVQQRYTRSPR